jgi:hypothetical protein
MKKKLPNVTLYHSYDGKELIHIHIGGIETPEFRHGLALAQTFDKMEDAEKFAESVQKYLDILFAYEAEERNIKK